MRPTAGRSDQRDLAIPRRRFDLPILAVAIASFAACTIADHATVTLGSSVVGENGEQVVYATSGAGCPIVLVGGGSAMDSRQWDRPMRDLAGRFRVTRYDSRGVGASDPPTSNYSDEADLAQALDDLGLGRVIVAGNSSGGAFVLEFAHAYPDRVAGVAAIAPFIPGWEFTGTMQARVMALGAAVEAGGEAFIEAILADPHFIPAPDNPAARDRAVELIRDGFASMTDFDPALARSPETPLVDRVGEINTPTLLLVGALDHDDLHRRMAFLEETMPEARLTRIDRAGHTLTLESPDAVVREITAFADRLGWGEPNDCR
jgi:pimeloyl-ACP methyl ester carboxylesterase